jgi:phosphonate transport system substrate-binding protein
MVDKGILDMDDLVEVWKSPLIPNGPIVVRTSLDADIKSEVQALHARPAEDRTGLLRRHPGRRLQGLHRSHQSDFYQPIIDARKAQIGG